MDKLSPEVREKIERALRESERAVDEATRNLPDFKLMIPDIDKLQEKILRIYQDKDGKIRKFDGDWSPEEQARFKAEMDKMREELKRIGPEIREQMRRNGAFKELRNLRDHPEIRIEMEKARKEMERAHEEMRAAHEKMRKELREERERARKEKPDESKDEKKESKPDKKPESPSSNFDPV